MYMYINVRTCTYTDTHAPRFRSSMYKRKYACGDLVKLYEQALAHVPVYTQQRNLNSEKLKEPDAQKNKIIINYDGELCSSHRGAFIIIAQSPSRCH